MNNWPVKKLGEVCEVVSGGTPDTNNHIYWNGDILWATPKDISKLESAEVFETERKITEDGLRNSSAKILPIGSVLLTTRAPIGNLAVAGKPIATNQGFKSFICRKEIDNWYLFYLLKSKIGELQSLGRGATFTEISKKIVENFEIPVPGIEEQRRIVKKLEKILSKIEEAHTLRQESKKEIQAVIRSALKKTFDDLSKKYDKKEIKDFGEVKGGKRLPAGHSFASLPTEYPYLRVVDFKDYSIDTTNMKYLGVATQQEISRYTISDKDSYISIAGTIGTVGTIPPQLSGANLTENAAKIVFNREAEVNNRFIVYFLDSPQGKDAIKKRTNQVGQPKLALMRIETIEVPLPDLIEQEKIVAYFDSLSEKVQALQKLQEEQLQELEILKQSVLHQAFQREL